MTYFVLYTALLLAASFFVGALLACLLRKAIGPRRRATVAAAGAAAGAMAAGPAVTERKEDSLFGPRDPETQRALDEAARSDDPVPVAVATAPRQAEPSREILPSPDADGYVPSATAAAVAGAAAASALTTVVAPQPEAPEPQGLPVAVGPPDDLLQLRGMDDDTARRLNDAGITRYDQLAQLSAENVNHLNRELGSPAAISRHSWIEQAAILAAGRETYYARRQRNGARTTGNAPPIAAVSPQPQQEPVTNSVADADGVLGTATTETATGAPPSADDLKLIRGVGLVIEKKLHAMGIYSYSQIAAWDEGDIEKVNAILDFSGRIERENWIEQARELAGKA